MYCFSTFSSFDFVFQLALLPFYVFLCFVYVFFSSGGHTRNINIQHKTKKTFVSTSSLGLKNFKLKSLKIRKRKKNGRTDQAKAVETVKQKRKININKNIDSYKVFLSPFFSYFIASLVSG